MVGVRNVRVPVPGLHITMIVLLAVALSSDPCFAANVFGNAWSKTKGYFQSHPRARSVGTDAAIGAGLGSLAGVVNRRGLVGGAFIGATAGTLYGLTKTSPTMDDHPIVKSTFEGAAIGLGAGGHGSTALLGGVIGSAVGIVKPHHHKKKQAAVGPTISAGPPTVQPPALTAPSLPAPAPGSPPNTAPPPVLSAPLPGP